MSVETEQKLVNLLKSGKSVEGVSLFKHLGSTLHKLINDPSKSAKNLEEFELLSDFVKKNSFINKQPETDKEVNNKKKVEGTNHAWISGSQKLIKVSSFVSSCITNQIIN